MFVAFCETVLWTGLVPYLVWQQWSGYLALGLLAWWTLYYWVPFSKLVYDQHKWNKEAAKYPALVITEENEEEPDPLEGFELPKFEIDIDPINTL